MVKKMGDYKIPFNENGNQMHYGRGYRDVVWKDNFKFIDTIKITGTQRGRSAAYFQAESIENGKKYTLFISDLLDMLLYTTIEKGVVKGTFTFRKRGENFGIAVLET